MTVYLVRHARAGSRGRWKGDDALRPLSKVGKAQANGIAKLLGDKPIELIVSSPFTSGASARSSRSPRSSASTIETSDALAEGARAVAGAPVVREGAGP